MVKGTHLSKTMSGMKSHRTGIRGAHIHFGRHRAPVLISLFNDTPIELGAELTVAMLRSDSDAIDVQKPRVVFLEPAVVRA